jgi:phosphinothricin acetyltransferase
MLPRRRPRVGLDLRSGMPRIRDAAPADLAAINAIYNFYVPRSTCTWAHEPRSDEEAAQWLAAHQPPAPHPATVALDDGGAVIGYAALSPFRPREGYRFTVENSVYVRDDQHGRGVGGALLADLVARARALGHHAIVAGISADQEPSLRLHLRAGFTQVAMLPQVGHKFDRWLDLAMLQLLL